MQLIVYRNDQHFPVNLQFVSDCHREREIPNFKQPTKLIFDFLPYKFSEKDPYSSGGTRWRSWLKHCATSRKAAGSIPDGVTGIFHWHTPSSRTMALGLTQPLTEMSTRNISWVKGGRCVGLTTSPTSCADCLVIWEPQTSGTLRACPGL